MKVCVFFIANSFNFKLKSGSSEMQYVSEVCKNVVLFDNFQIWKNKAIIWYLKFQNVELKHCFYDTVP